MNTKICFLLTMSLLLFSSLFAKSIGEVVDVLPDGTKIIGYEVPPSPPPAELMPSVELPEKSRSVNYLEDFPAFDWCYGCSATAAAMIAAYWDTHGYSNVYTGPQNNGNMPQTNSAWGEGECPLSATHQGFDGLMTRGNVDDYWIEYGNSDPDPYIQNGWTQHEWADCTADFMGTNQSYWNSGDGSTWFYWGDYGAPLYDFTNCENYTPRHRDGCHGFREFFESRDYEIVTNFTQTIVGYNGYNNGFSFDDFVDEIDNGNPVIIQVSGHSMVGFGYDTSGQQVYIKDTWDHSTHSMTWGGSYSDMEHYGVTVCRLEPVENDYYVGIDFYSCMVGDVETIHVFTSDLEESDGIIAYQFELGYDPEIISYVDYNIEETLSDGGIVTVNDNSDGLISVAYMTTSALTGSGNILEIDFEGISPGDSPLTISNFFYNTEQVYNIENGELSVAPNINDYSISIDDYQCELGDSVTVDIYTSEIFLEDNVIAYQFDLTFDPDVVQFIDYDTYGTLSTGGIVTVNDNAGVLSVAFMTTDHLSDNGNLLKLVFQGVNSGYSALELSNFYYNTEEVTDLTDGSITVIGEAQHFAISIDDYSCDVGDPVTIDIETSDITLSDNIIAYQFVLHYDPEKIYFDDYETSVTLSYGGIVTTNSNNGTLTVAFMTSNAITGSGSLLKLFFNGLTSGYSVLDIDDFFYNTEEVTDLTDGSLTVYENPPDFALSIGNYQCNVGNSVNVGVETSEISLSDNVIAYQFEIEYDQEVVSFNEAIIAGTISDGGIITTNDEYGTLSVAYMTSSPITGIGDLLQLSFTGISDGLSTLEISDCFYNTDQVSDLTDGLIAVVDVPDYAIEIGEYTSIVGNTLVIDVMTSELTLADNIIAYQFNLQFDEEIISFNDYITDETLSAGGLLDYNCENGNLSIAFMTTSPLIGSGSLLKLSFHCDISGESDLTISDFLYNTEPVYDITNGSVIVNYAGPDWEFYPYEYEFSLSMWGTVFIDDVQIDHTDGILGCFVGDECRGIASTEYENVIDYTQYFGHVAYMPMVYSNQTSGETVTFKYWDPFLNEIHDVDGSIEFVADDFIGNGYDPYIFNVNTSPEIDIIKSMTSGWNFFSINVVNDDMTINNVLASLEDHGSDIKSQVQSAVYYPGPGWLGSLTEFDNYKMYKIEMTESDTLLFSGMPAEVSEINYQLSSGWNWISYAPQIPSNINDALAPLEDSGILIKNQTAFANYYQGVGWLGALSTLYPLDGYMLSLNESIVFTYPLASAQMQINYSVNINEPNDTDPFNPYNYEFSSTMVISSEDQLLPDSQILAYHDNELRGQSIMLDYTELTGKIYYALMVYSDQPLEEDFELFYKSDEMPVQIGYSFDFVENDAVGSFMEPLMLDLPNTEENDNIQPVNQISISPNPFNPSTNIYFELSEMAHVTIDIYNLKGQKITNLTDRSYESGKHYVNWNAVNCSSGIYMMHYNNGESICFKKLLLLK